MRTLIRMQSLLISQTKIIFNKKHKALLKLQRHGRKIDLNTIEDRNVSDASIIYGSDNVIDKEINSVIPVNYSTNQSALDSSAIESYSDFGV